MDSKEKKVFVFDLDETLFSARKRLLNKTYKNSLEKWKLNNKYYVSSDPKINLDFYALFKDRMREIMNNIINNGHKLAFITSGGFTKELLIEFYADAYEINLDPNGILFFNNQNDKTFALETIIKANQNAEIIFTDNNNKHLTEAEKLNEIYGNIIKIIPARTNRNDSNNYLGNEHLVELERHAYQYNEEYTQKIKSPTSYFYDVVKDNAINIATGVFTLGIIGLTNL